MRLQNLAVLLLVGKERGGWRQGGRQAWLLGPSVLLFHVAVLPAYSSMKLGPLPSLSVAVKCWQHENSLQTLQHRSDGTG